MDENTKFICYEEGCEGVYTMEDLRKMWDDELDRNNFADFESWLLEMMQFQILVISAV